MKKLIFLSLAFSVFVVPRTPGPSTLLSATPTSGWEVPAASIRTASAVQSPIIPIAGSASSAISAVIMPPLSVFP